MLEDSADDRHDGETSDDLRCAALQAAVAQIPDDYFDAYGGGWLGEISTALIDAVFSIRARYRAADPEAGVIGRVRAFQRVEHEAIDDLKALSALGSERLQEIMGSTKTAQRLKAEAVVEAADAFIGAGVVHANDFLKADREGMKRTYTSVQGLGWVTFEYFSMLLGVPGVKADTMLTRYVNNAMSAAGLGSVSPYEARTLVVDGYETLKLGKTLSYFEHAIWKFQSDLSARSRK